MLEVEIQEEVTLGSVVEIDGHYYIVLELPSCVSYETKPEWRHYLHALSGESYYNYPMSFKDLKSMIKRNGWKVYNEHSYKLVVMSVKA